MMQMTESIFVRGLLVFFPGTTFVTVFPIPKMTLASKCDLILKAALIYSPLVFLQTNVEVICETTFADRRHCLSCCA